MKPTNHLIKEISRRKFLERSIKGGIAVAAAPAILSNLVSCGPSGSAVPHAIDPDVLTRTIMKALERAGDFAEVYVENRVTRRISLEESKFKNAVYGVSRGAGVRVIAGEKTGYAFTEEITEENLLRAAETASYIASGSASAGPVELKTARMNSYNVINLPLQEIADEQRMDVMQRSHQAALDYDDRITMARVSYYDEVRDRTIANSEGLLISDSQPLISYGVSALGVGNDTRHMGSGRLSMHHGFEMFDKVESPESVAERGAREAIDMLAAQEAPAGKMDVVMQNGWGGVLIHEAVGHPLEGDNIAKKIGAFTGKLNQKVASDVFTMVDDGTIPNRRGTISFDDEGTPAQRNVLIDKGVLKGYMHDILSSKMLDMKRTGSGRRMSFRNIPIPRMTNTFIEAGNTDPKDIIKDTKNGLYVQSLSGGSVNSVTSQFNFTCREAYIIENGELTTPVKGATLVGTSVDVISSVDVVGNDLDFGPGTCGKGGQSAECDCGQPTVRIRGINVGGSRQRG